MRTNAYSIYNELDEKASLAEIYGAVIEGVRKLTLSNAMKSTAYTGNPAAGSVEFKRLVNADVTNYGAARSNGKGANIIAQPITVNIDQRKEIVEEINRGDLDTFGVPALMRRRVVNHLESMSTHLDIEFFKTASLAASNVIVDVEEIGYLKALELSIQTLETVKNNYVQGVSRNLIDVICSTAFYGEIREKLDQLPNPNVDTAAEEFGLYHGVRVYNSINLPDDVGALFMVRGAVALPVVTYPYTEPEKIPLSNEFAVSLFFNYGKKALTDDLIFKINNNTGT